MLSRQTRQPWDDWMLAATLAKPQSVAVVEDARFVLVAAGTGDLER